MLSANIPTTTRKAVYRRDGYRCIICDDPRALQIHHIIHRSQGGSNSPHNLVTLCWRCHALAHGTQLADLPDYLAEMDFELACVEYVADMYAPDWWPFAVDPAEEST